MHIGKKLSVGIVDDRGSIKEHTVFYYSYILIIHKVVIFDIGFIIAFENIVIAPEFTVNKYHAGGIFLCADIPVVYQRGEKLVSEQTSPQNKRFRITVFFKKRKEETAVSVIFFSGIKPQAFLGITPGGIAIDADSRFLGKYIFFVGIEIINVGRALPFAPGLVVIGGQVIGWVSAVCDMVIIGLPEDIDTDLLVEKIFWVGYNREDTGVFIIAFITHKIGGGGDVG